ncbi:GTP pyrophosphokinase family protein [Amycolatopsis sp. lyj-84]|uniref:GTP pyrophosphokinase n=1 Tax=Amycolatopsis sp. lyj-84 TaxID=2789284 RepID=UPI00397CDB5A
MVFDTNGYNDYAALCGTLGAKLRPLITDLLDTAEIQVHSVDYRVKTIESLEKKLERKSDKYASIEDITDILGLRIVTYFRDDVDKVASIVESEFLIDIANSINKSDSLDPDRFGYTSLHYIASIATSRSSLAEYRKYSEFRFEIQIRSILQHAWAEIEHDLGYKSKVEVPRQVVRRFSRLASLLELADDEFVETRGALQEYATEIQGSIGSSRLDIDLNLDSVLAYITQSALVANLDAQISNAVGEHRLETNASYAAARLEELKLLGYGSVLDVNNQLADSSEPLVALATSWLRHETPPGFESPHGKLVWSRDSRSEKGFHGGISLFYLFMLEVARKPQAESQKLLIEGHLRHVPQKTLRALVKYFDES